MFKNEFDYRNEYFKKHKGFLGTGLYFCSYCGKPIRKKGSHIDHIIPKSKNQYILNRSFNTTIACAKCNLKKSDKIDYRIVQGYASKVGGAAVGTAVGTTAKVAGGTLKGAGVVAGYGAKGAGRVAKYGVRGTFWTIKQIFGGTLTVIRSVLSTIIRLMLRNWLITAIIGYVMFQKYF